MTPFYAGIGSRSTPEDVLQRMQNIGQILDEYDYILRSGHADGADKAFEYVSTSADIYLPWKAFNGSNGTNGDVRHIVAEMSSAHTHVARTHHPAWNKLSPAAQKLMIRNVYQVLGDNIDDKTQYSSFVICWTPNGSGSGGTGQAIRIANNYNIPVFDLGKIDGWEKLIEFGRTL